MSETNTKYILNLQTGTITAEEAEKGTKIKVRGHEGDARVVTATLNHLKGEKYFRYKKQIWFPEKAPWIKVQEG